MHPPTVTVKKFCPEDDCRDSEPAPLRFSRLGTTSSVSRRVEQIQ